MGGTPSQGKIGLQESDMSQDQLKRVKQMSQDRLSPSKLCAARKGDDFFCKGLGLHIHP